MNLEEIKQAFQDKVNEKVQQCITSIDNLMIYYYKDIEKEKEITFLEKNFANQYENDLPENIRDSTMEELREHYAENWIIKQKTISKKGRAWTFTLKENIKIKKEPIFSEETKEEPVENRSEILDL